MEKCPFRILRRKEGGVFEVCKHAQHSVCCEDLVIAPSCMDSWCHEMIMQALEARTELKGL